MTVFSFLFLVTDSFEGWSGILYYCKNCNYFSTNLIEFTSIEVSDVFLMVRLGWWVMYYIVKCHFHHIISRVHTINMTYHCWCWPWSPRSRLVWQVSPLWSYFFSVPFHTVCFGITSAQPTLNEELKHHFYFQKNWQTIIIQTCVFSDRHFLKNEQIETVNSRITVDSNGCQWQNFKQKIKFSKTAWQFPNTSTLSWWNWYWQIWFFKCLMKYVNTSNSCKLGLPILPNNHHLML